MATLSSPSQSATVLGKRKAETGLSDPLILHLGSSPDPQPSASFYIPVNNGRLPDPKRPYACSFEGCVKTYKKPSRLAEHERSHTGVRPYVCAACNKSYLRETHLQAHSRSHQQDSDKPFACPEASCDKRFWTAQHLRVHGETHSGEKPFKCADPGCEESFSKHHQLRTHTCTLHAPAGTKPYACTHPGCPKSFSTNQKLTTHVKVHEDKRYACVHPACLPGSTPAPAYFATWTALQHHVRTAHPPACPHASCAGRTFTQQKGLRAHLRLHEQRAAGDAIERGVADARAGDEEEPERPQKRRRGGEFGRDWRCDAVGCDKDFKSKRALATHHNVSHLGRRDHVCPRPSCQHAFGYKHLLQRHMAKVHSTGSSAESAEGTAAEMTAGEDTAEETDDADTAMARPSTSAIDALTGKTYSLRLRSGKALQCPYPDLASLAATNVPGPSSGGHHSACDYVFTRAYDLRRHLKAEHGVVVGKEMAETWVKGHKPTSTTP